MTNVDLKTLEELDGAEAVVFDDHAFRDHEQVVFGFDRASGLKAIIALHRVREGRALGGCRTRAYASERAALNDALRLSHGMSYKSAFARLPCGGAKAVIIRDPVRPPSEAALRAMGRLVEALDGRYVTAEDMGTGTEQLKVIGQETRWVLGTDPVAGAGAPFTALGVFNAIRAAVAHTSGADDLRGLTIAVQGAGSVGAHLCEMVAERGAQLVIADIDVSAAERVAARTDAQVVPADIIHRVDADILAPCAVGGTLNSETIPSLGCRIVTGAANNQLRTPRDGINLHERGITYVPDYIASAGGIINGVQELLGYDKAAVERKCGEIFNTALNVLSTAQSSGQAVSLTADLMAQEMLGGATAGGS